MKKTIILILLSVFMPIFSVLYAQSVAETNPLKSRIEKELYDKEDKRGNYQIDAYQQKLDTISKKIDDRKWEIFQELAPEPMTNIERVGWWIFIAMVIVMICVLAWIATSSDEFDTWERLFAVAFCFILIYVIIVFPPFVDEWKLAAYRAENFISDKKISAWTAEQKEIKEYLTNSDIAIRKAIKTAVDSVYPIELEKQREFIRKNNISKKLRIIEYYWESEKDSEERASLNGYYSSKGGGAGFLLNGFGLGGGKSNGYGRIGGAYRGRIYGEKRYILHFILSDNSYHIINAKENPEWRMAKKHMMVKYEKIYTDFTQYREVFTPLWTE